MAKLDGRCAAHAGARRSLCGDRAFARPDRQRSQPHRGEADGSLGRSGGEIAASPSRRDELRLCHLGRRGAWSLRRHQSGIRRSKFVASTAEPVLYDTVYLLDENHRDVFAYRNGEPVFVSSSQAFGSALATMTAKVPDDGRNYSVETGIIKTPWGLETVAVGPVVPSTKAPLDSPQRARMLIIARALDDAAVLRLEGDFVIPELHLAEATAPHGIALTDPTGVIRWKTYVGSARARHTGQRAGRADRVSGVRASGGVCRGPYRSSLSAAPKRGRPSWQARPWSPAASGGWKGALASAHTWRYLCSTLKKRLCLLRMPATPRCAARSPHPVPRNTPRKPLSTTGNPSGTRRRTSPTTCPITRHQQWTTGGSHVVFGSPSLTAVPIRIHCTSCSGGEGAISPPHEDAADGTARVSA